MMTRRKFFAKTVAAAGVTALGSVAADASDSSPQASSPDQATHDYTPVITPNGSTLPFRLVDGVKVFHLIAEEVRNHEFAPGLKAHCWGFNGQVHGPTIEAVEGDRVRFYVTNHLPEPTSIHWHGIRVPNGMDGVSGLNQAPIESGETFKYEFTLRQNGTFMYHSHYDEMTQQALGMMGMFIVHPRQSREAASPVRDFALLLSEWRIDPGTMRPNPMEMTDFNVLTMNAKVFPGTAPLEVQTGDRVRVRIGNLSAMDHHPIHIHGHNWKVVETDGGQVPESAQFYETTILVPVGSTRTMEFIADNPGDWAMHCHMSHHTMNQMGHSAANMLGVEKGNLDKRVGKFFAGYMTMGEAGMGEMGEMDMGMPRNSLPMVGAPGKHGYIDMGGMFTILKVRENLPNGNGGWYNNPPGTLASRATDEEMARDLAEDLSSGKHS